MTIRHLKIFVTVCDCGSITEASKRLFVSQPSISVAIKNLESYYGVKLFDRMPKKLVITEAGKQMLEQARHITDLYYKLEDGVKNWDNAGVLRVGSSITIGNCLIPEYVERFREKYDAVEVYVTINSSKTIERMILENKLDIALIEGVPSDRMIESESFMDDELIVICNVNHPLREIENVTLKQLAANKFVLREKGSGTREFFDSALLVHDIIVKPMWESVSTQALVKAVKLGFGISVLPLRLAENDIRLGNVARLHVEGFELKRKFSVIYHSNKYITKSVQEFISICKGKGE